MIRTGARRCIPCRGHVTWRVGVDSAPPRRAISTTPLQEHPGGQCLRHFGFKGGHTEVDDILGESTRPGTDLSESEADWGLDTAWPSSLSLAEQEALYTRSNHGKTMTEIRVPCPACEMNHNLSCCPFVFEANPLNFDKPVGRNYRFQKRIKESQEFHDAVEYLRRKFIDRTPSGYLFALRRSQTQDAPPLAREWLSCFEGNVIFVSNKDHERLRAARDAGWNFCSPTRSHFTGHYSTKDHDGRPFVIVFANTSNFDERMPHEINMIRSFVTEYNRGTKSLYDVRPNDDVRPVGLVMVIGRWHKSQSAVTGSAPCISFGIASEYSWPHGYSRFTIHIGAKNNHLKEGYSWWTTGNLLEGPESWLKGHRFFHTGADTASYFDNENKNPAWLAGVAQALLRDVREPVERIYGPEEAQKDWDRVVMWRKVLLHRATTFYGTDSSQYHALYVQTASTGFNDWAAGLKSADILPRWRHLQSIMSMADKPYEDKVIWRSVFESSSEEKLESDTG